MASVRLTKGDKETITRKLVAYKYDPILKALSEEAYILAEQVLKEVIPKPHQKLLEEVPKDWVTVITHCDLRVAGTVVRLDWTAASKYIKVPPPLARTYGPIWVFDRDHPLTEKLENWEASDRSYRKDRTDRFNQIKGMLAGITSLNRLLEVWPEAEPFLPSHLKNPMKPSLPALPIQQLNLALGLPVPDEKETVDG